MNFIVSEEIKDREYGTTGTGEITEAAEQTKPEEKMRSEEKMQSEEKMWSEEKMQSEEKLQSDGRPQPDGEAETENTESAADTSSDAGVKDSFKKGFFTKKKDKKDEQIEELTDRVKRNMAEFDNFRKRTEKEKSLMYEIGAKDIVEKILPVVDNFERGLAAIPEAEQKTAFAEGMDMIYKQLLKTLEDAGVKPIEAVGQPFDPNFHNAVMHVEDESMGDNVVADELQKGYLYRDSVVRHSMVKVAN